MNARCPSAVPEEPELLGLAVTSGFDTDGDGRADTVVHGEQTDLVVHTDLDGDGWADQVLRIGADGVVRNVPHVSPAQPVWDGADAGFAE
ncbi:DUF6802 family protein [Pseudonocardia sp. TRM90224]|uniref:DUF6802 family protein n=1 Tax=Pseudonocardia sp. TRM90224 TaxID=2812678 RepID=UPI001E5A4FAA|nr:DUF6802 family protein [Pseudonocardia sp. TRM90224]